MSCYKCLNRPISPLSLSLSLSPVDRSSGQRQHAAVGDRFFPHSNWTGRSASLPSEEHPSVPQRGHHRAVQPPDCRLIYLSLLDHTVFRELSLSHTLSHTHTHTNSHSHSHSHTHTHTHTHTPSHTARY